MASRISGWSALVACALAASAANGTTTLLSDNFEEDPVGLGQTSLANWTVARGSVDVLAAGEFGVTGRGHFLDMDGTDKFAAKLVSDQTFALTPGTVYTLSFDVGGSMRSAVPAPNTMTVSLGDAFSTTVTKNFNDPFVTLTFPITVSTATTANLVFDHQGGDQVGLLLDNVLLTAEQTAPGPVPIPLPVAAWMGAATMGGILLVGGTRGRRTRRRS